MQYRTLESEVNALNAEVTRLRIMVNRCVEAQDNARQTQLVVHEPTLQQRTHHPQRNYPTVSSSVDPISNVLEVLPTSTKLPLPGEPMSVLPTIFSGMDGTARLFKVLIETYPWLLPSDLRQAQFELEEEAREKAALAHKRRSRKKKIQKHTSSSSSSSSSSDSSSSESEDAEEAALLERLRLQREKRKEKKKAKEDKKSIQKGNTNNKKTKKSSQEHGSESEDDQTISSAAKQTATPVANSTPRSISPTQAYVPPKRSGMSPSADAPLSAATTPTNAVKARTTVNSVLDDVISTPSAVQGLLNHRASAKKKQSYLTRVGQDSEDEEAEMALANTKSSLKLTETPKPITIPTVAAAPQAAKRRNSTDSTNSYNSFVDETQKPKAQNDDDTLNF